MALTTLMALTSLTWSFPLPFMGPRAPFKVCWEPLILTWVVVVLVCSPCFGIDLKSIRTEVLSPFASDWTFLLVQNGLWTWFVPLPCLVLSMYTFASP